MKFEYLREFVTAARASEMQKAAAELGVSPSSLSKHIRAIEQELGVELFTKTRKTGLSRYGNVFLPYARALVELQEEYLAEFSEKRSSQAGDLYIGISPIQFRERAGQLIERYMTSAENNNVHIREFGNSELTGRVKSGQCDVAFVRTQPALMREAELVYLPFCRDRLVAFLPLEHPLSGEKSICFSQLKNEKILLRSENSAICRVCTEVCRKEGFEPNLAFVGTYVVYDMVRRGEGVTLYLAPPAAPDYSSPFAIVPIDPPLVSFVDVVFRIGPQKQSLTDFLAYITRGMNQRLADDTFGDDG